MTLMQSITNHMIRYNRVEGEKIYGPCRDIYMDMKWRMKRLLFLSYFVVISRLISHLLKLHPPRGKYLILK